MKKILLLGALLSTLCANCFAENWVKVCNVIEYEYHMDIDSVVTSGPSVYSYKYKLVDPKDDFKSIMPYDQTISFYPHQDKIGEVTKAAFSGVYKNCAKKDLLSFTPGGTDVNIRKETNTNCEVLSVMNPSAGANSESEYYLLNNNEGDGSWSKIAVFVPKDELWELTIGYVKSQYAQAK